MPTKRVFVEKLKRGIKQSKRSKIKKENTTGKCLQATLGRAHGNLLLG